VNRIAGLRNATKKIDGEEEEAAEKSIIIVCSSCTKTENKNPSKMVFAIAQRNLAKCFMILKKQNVECMRRDGRCGEVTSGGCLVVG
jgi:hypothetical protein